MINCFVCDYDQVAIFKKFKKRDQLDVKASGASRLSTNLGRCKRCGHIQQHPVIASEVVESLYANSDDEGFVKFNQDRIESFKSALDKIAASGVNLSGKRGLDVGCGGGAFPRAGQEVGIEITGVEPSKFLSKYARDKYGLDVKTGFLQDVIGELSKPYDFISFWDVLEHIYDVNEIIQLCDELLADNGYLIVNVPAVDSWPARLMGRNWPMYLDVHVQYFNTSSLTELMAKHGFCLLAKNNYWQRLPLGYVIYRGFFHLTGISIDSLKMGGKSPLPLSYYIGQKCFIFGRKSNIAQ